MPVRSDTNEYALGSDTAEQERLVRQAAWLANHTESFFRRAGIGPGHRVLDLGSGVGGIYISDIHDNESNSSR